MRKIELKNNELSFSEKVLGFLERGVSPIGNSGKVDCPKRFIGKRAYLIVCEDEFRKKSKKTGRGKQETERRKSVSKTNNSGINEED